MNLNFETVGVNINNKGKPDYIATPIHICKDMSNLFDYTNCNSKIWLDLYCKTGNTLQALKENGVNKNNIAAICDNKQSQMLVCRKLYGKILPEVEVEIAVKSLEAFKITRRGQIYWVSDWKTTVKDNYQDAYNLIKFVILKEMERTMSLEFTSEDGFQINNVIMNPPYNNDMYIDFVLLAKNIATDSTVAITPAKFQAKGGEKNEIFRRDVAPYISDIVSYPCTKDVFENVAEAGGVSYYLIDNNRHDSKNIMVKCSMQKLFETVGVEEHSGADIVLLNSICARIVSKCEASIHNNLGNELHFNQSYYVQNTDSGNKEKKFNDDVEIFGGKAGGEVGDNGAKFFKLGYKPVRELKRTDNLDKYKVCISCMTGGTSFFGLFNMDGTAIGLTPASIIGPNQVPKGSYYCLKTFEYYSEAESLKSYLNSRLIRFLVRCSVVGTTLTSEFFRFVPNPINFDHIFTDEELYKKYSLTEEEIAIIESVIKERK